MSVATVPKPWQQHLDPTVAAIWHESCPKKVRKTYRSAPQLGWSEWISHLQSRKRCTPLARILPGGSKALHWSLPENLSVSATAQLLQELATLIKKRNGAARLTLSRQLQAWLADTSEFVGIDRALETVGWIEALPFISDLLPEHEWWRLISEAIRVADEFELANPEVSPLAGQLLDCELKIALGHMLPEVRRAHELGELGRERLSQSMTDVTDEAGLVPQCAPSEFFPLVASWARCAAMLRDQGYKPWNKDAQKRFDLAVCNLLRLMRSDISLPFEDAQRKKSRRKAIEAISHFVRKQRVSRLADSLLRKDHSSLHRHHHPGASVHSEPSCLGVLRTNWSARSPRLIVRYADRQVTTELSIGGEVVWSGATNPQLRIAGKSLPISSAWEEVCWVSEEDVDYLELEASFGANHRVQRQILLAKEDKFVYLADAVLGDASAALAYQLSLPLALKMRFKPAEESREGMLVGRKTKAIVLPVGLGEWRSDRSRGELMQDDSGLRLQQEFHAPRAYAPLFIGFDPERLERGLTWRQLTVAETREAQPADVAVGFRVQLNRRQWLFYRSLAAPSIRTVLAQNLKTEFLAARFHGSGKTTTIVEVEP